MKTSLKKISNDEDLPVKILYSGKYRNSNGSIKHGVYLRKYKNTINKLFINDGHLMSLYRYPNINCKFSSSKINDYNLHLCGGWSFKDVNREEAIIRVINDLKPMGFLVTTEVEKWKDICEKSKLDFIIKPNHIPTEKHFDIGISCKGTFEENFDIKTLIEDYINYLGLIKFQSTQEISNFILSLKNTKISYYLNSNYTNPESIQDIIITGLILGYPIETTVSIIKNLIN